MSDFSKTAHFLETEAANYPKGSQIHSHLLAMAEVARRLAREEVDRIANGIADENAKQSAKPR